MAADKKMKFRVKPNMLFGLNNQHKGGDVVELTEDEAGPFMDKLIPLEESPKGKNKKAQGAGGGDDLNLVNAAEIG